jgi:transposase InsO family protein
MSKRGRGCVHDQWAIFRHSIVGNLLVAPPKRGELHSRLEELAQVAWEHPTTGELMGFAVPTIERWYYQALSEPQDPISALRKKVRKDAGTHRILGEKLRRALRAQYESHKTWSYQLHADNIAVLCEEDPSLGEMPSYATVWRYMQSQGLLKQRRPPNANRPGAERALARLASHEVRSYESEYVHGLWHLDFHHGSRKVLTRAAELKVPKLLGVLDDRSRVACHLQWYLEEDTESLVHGLSQGFQKRPLPRKLMTDGGPAMSAEETQAGLSALSILHEKTLAYSPYQNGKQEVFWAQVEGRLLPMLEGVPDLTLSLLNEATQAWVEREYNREIHSETGQAPLARMLAGPSVGRESPSSETLRDAFRGQVERTQRRSDGTLSLGGVRFELPSRYRHLRHVAVRYAEWDLSHVHLVDPRTNTLLCRLYPLDKVQNSDGLRRRLGPVEAADPAPPPAKTPAGMAPLLSKLIADYAATGLPPAYLPKDSSHTSSEDEMETR